MALKNVLLAEDDEDDVLIFTIALSESRVPHALIVVRDGDELMAQLSKTLPDIIFLDVMMPCKNGRVCIREIRANPKYDSIPVVILTSLDDSNTREFFQIEKADGFLTKPASIRELTANLTAILNSRQSQINIL